MCVFTLRSQRQPSVITDYQTSRESFPICDDVDCVYPVQLGVLLFILISKREYWCPDDEPDRLHGAVHFRRKEIHSLIFTNVYSVRNTLHLLLNPRDAIYTWIIMIPRIMYLRKIDIISELRGYCYTSVIHLRYGLMYYPRGLVANALWSLWVVSYVKNKMKKLWIIYDMNT